MFKNSSGIRYQKNKERLQNQARGRYQELSETKNDNMNVSQRKNN